MARVNFQFSTETLKAIHLRIAKENYTQFTLEETQIGYTIYQGKTPVFYDGTLEYLAKYSLSWKKFLASTTKSERMKWCNQKAKTANQIRFRIIPTYWKEKREEVFKVFWATHYKKQTFDSSLEFRHKAPPRMVTLWDNWQTRAMHLEKEAYQAETKLTKEDVWKVLKQSQGKCYYCGSTALEKLRGSWGKKGNQIGSLDHILPLNKGGNNNFENLAWSCLACNVGVWIGYTFKDDKWIENERIKKRKIKPFTKVTKWKKEKAGSWKETIISFE